MVRGQNDLLGNHDIDDILNLIDGRAELTQELRKTADDVRVYLAGEFNTLLKSPDITYALQSKVGGDVGREQLVFKLIECCAGL